MKPIASFARANRKALASATTLLVSGLVGFPYFIGLSAIVPLVLTVLLVAATLTTYRLLIRKPIDWSRKLASGTLAASAIAAIAVIGLAIQAVPYGHDLTNPLVTGEPAWDSPQTRQLMVRTCFACHSNEIDYPWYSRMAPVSWAVRSHVDEGRSKVNYSEWDRPQRERDESLETLVKGEMPPAYFTRIGNSAAQLTDEERNQLIVGLRATFGSESGGESADGGDD